MYIIYYHESQVYTTGKNVSLISYKISEKEVICLQPNCPSVARILNFVEPTGTSVNLRKGNERHYNMTTGGQGHIYLLIYLIQFLSHSPTCVGSFSNMLRILS